MKNYKGELNVAAKLQCEICGGKLIGKPGGIFECDSCGMEYDTAWAKAKIQEITGTVKVEGTVEVQGSVKVEGPVKVEGTANVDSLVKRATILREDGEFIRAIGVFNEALAIEPENADAYLGILLSELRLRSAEQLSTLRFSDYLIPTVLRDVGMEKVRIIKIIRSINHMGLAEAKSLVEHLPTSLMLTSSQVKELEQAGAVLTVDTSGIKAYGSFEEVENSSSYQRFLQYGDPVFTDRIRKAIQTARRTVEEEERLKKEEAERIKAESSENKRRMMCAKAEALKPLRDKYAPLYGIFAAGGYHSVGLLLDGTVIAAGDNGSGQCDVSDWFDIVFIAAGYKHTVGVKANGTAVAVGDNQFGQCDVSDWTDIVAVDAGSNHTIGLKADGTVVAAGDNEHKQCDVCKWTDIVAITAGHYESVGLKADGTVVRTNTGIRNASALLWSNIAAVSSGAGHLAGLKQDGTVVASGSNYGEQCYVADWTDIVAVSAGSQHTVGLKADGTVVITGFKGIPYDRENDVPDWTDIVAVIAGEGCTFGIRADGTVVAKNVIKPDRGRCNVADWKLFNRIDSFERDRVEAAERAKRERQEKLAALTKERDALRIELGDLKGIFFGKRRKEIEARLAEIDTALKKLN